MFKNFKFLVLFLLFILFFKSSWALENNSKFPIPNYTATYSIQAYGINLGQSVQNFKIFKNNYIFSIETNTSALFYSDHMTQTSSGFIDKNNNLLPNKYNSHRDHKDQNESINFDWDKNLASSETSKINNKKLEQDDKSLKIGPEISPGLGDVLSIQIALRQKLLNYFSNLDNPIKKSFKFDLIKSNKIQTYDFEIIQHEKLKTILGDLDTLKIERVSSGDGTKLDIYWLAPSVQYLLVQSEQVEIDPSQPKLAPKVLVTLSLEKYYPQ